MNPEWQQFLTEQGADIAQGRVHRYQGHTPVDAADTEILCDLSHLGLIEVAGAEAADFLQSQLSNDIHQVSDHYSQLSAYCNPKGRMLASPRIFRHSDAYYLQLPIEILEPTLKRLRMFVLRAKAVLEDKSDSLARMGYAGPQAEQQLRTIVGEPPQAPNGCARQGDLTLLRIPAPVPRFELVGDATALSNIWRQLGASPAGDSAWALLDIFAGIPNVLAQTVEAFVPQMTNYELIDGVNFKKGCYPGQEVVARMHYLGKPKRRMYRLQFETNAAVVPGDDIYAFDGERDQPSGKIVDAQFKARQGREALAVLATATAEAGQVRLHTPDGAVAHIKNLPYEVSV